MPTVSVAINGRNFDIACDPGQEERVKNLASQLRERMEKISGSLGPVSESMLFAVTSLILTDELEQRSTEVAKLQETKTGQDEEKELLLASAIEDLAIRIESIAAKMEAA